MIYDIYIYMINIYIYVSYVHAFNILQSIRECWSNMLIIHTELLGCFNLFKLSASWRKCHRQDYSFTIFKTTQPFCLCLSVRTYREVLLSLCSPATPTYCTPDSGAFK